ncbi:MAG: hypothetical protein ACTHY1_03535 [Lactobacillus helveticus]
MKTNELLEELEEDIIQELKSEKRDRTLIAAVAYIATPIGISKLKLAQYFGTHSSYYLYNKKNTFVGHLIQRKLNKFKLKYNLTQIGDNCLTTDQIEYYFNHMHPNECIIKLNISQAYYYRFANKHVKNRPRLYSNRKNLSEESQHAKLKRLGFQNATEYISKFSPKAYRENILK